MALRDKRGVRHLILAVGPGVDIVVVSDSCHSGTVVRLAPTSGTSYDRDAEEADRDLQRQFAELKESFYQNLAVSRPGPGDPPFADFPRPVSAQEDEILLRSPAMAGVRAEAMVDDNGRPAKIFAPTPIVNDRSVPVGAVDASEYATRNMPLAINEEANETQDAILAQVKTRARSRAVVQARGLLLAGCADHQLSQEVGGAGVFTTRLNRVWASNTFIGDYKDLIRQVVSQMGPTQTPQLTTFGTDSHILAAKTPFNTA